MVLGNLEWPVSRIIPFDPHVGRESCVGKRATARFLPLTKRLALLRENKIRAARLPTSQRYRVQAEQYRFQARKSRDPITQAQMLLLAAICERKATQAGGKIS